MSWQSIVSTAICIAVFIVIIMMTLGGLNVTSAIARYAGIGVACLLGIITGPMLQRKIFG
jgi:hypothetical protein